MSAALLSGWGRTSPTRAEVVRPRAADEVAAAIAGAGERGVIARGLGRAYGDAAQNAGGRVLDMRGLTAVREVEATPAGGAVVAEAGLTLDRLMQLVVPLGWFVPVTPGTRFVTLGGALACDIHGKNHHRDGSFARHVEWFDLVTPGGSLRRVDAAAEPDLFAATAGGMGLTGVITAMRLRLIPIASDHIEVTAQRADNLDELIALMDERDEHHRYAVAWVDCLKRGRGFGRGIGLWGDHAASANGAAPRFAHSARLRVPDLVPAGALNATVARAFNEVWWRRAPRAATTTRESLAAYFHPLDGVLDWNRLYGPLGFVQYQPVVPLDRPDALRELLERLSATGTSSFLGVLKRFGPGNRLLSFPMPGWTLAVDIPAATPRLARLLDELDGVVAEAGGRVYLAKDARVHRELLDRMYPELPAWRAIVRGVDPGRTMRSDLARRLGLLDA